MKTEYKTLWIDDAHSTVAGHKMSIEAFLERQGIELKNTDITVKPRWNPESDNNFNECISDSELDMVFVDFNMANARNGALIISYIRKDLKHYHIPILFYTSEDDAQIFLQEKIFTSNKGEEDLNIADGIYFCERDLVGEKAKNILTSLLRKEAKPQRGRGLLMDRVSEIEAKVFQAINKHWLLLNEEQKNDIIFYTIKELRNKTKDIFKVYKGIEILKRDDSSLNEQRLKEKKELKKNLDYSSFLKKNYAYLPSNNRTRILNKILEIIGEFENEYNIIEELYKQDNELSLFKIRNRYAHETLKEIKEGHTDDMCVYIRKETTRQLNNIKKISENDE